MVDIPVWPGSSSFSPGRTPFGFFDLDPQFQLDADNVADWCAKRLGYPLVDIELQAENFYACLEEAVAEYSNQVNQYNNVFKYSIAGTSFTYTAPVGNYTVIEMIGAIQSNITTNVTNNSLTTSIIVSFDPIYNKIGFEFLHCTKPNYYYIEDHKRYHRYNYRKDILVKLGYPKELTEKQIMMDRKIYRIYDCGQYKYKFNLNSI